MPGAPRYLSALVACAVSLQATGALPLIASAQASCCCHHHDVSPDCRCPACTHARELASDQRFIRTCAGTTQPGLIAGQVAPAVPQPIPLAPVALSADRALSAAPIRAPSPAQEVPTPPPLA